LIYRILEPDLNEAGPFDIVTIVTILTELPPHKLAVQFGRASLSSSAFRARTMRVSSTLLQDVAVLVELPYISFSIMSIGI
jgi:hypothetical protein